MRKIIVTLIVTLFCGVASAQVNKTDPPTMAVPSPGTPPIENAIQKINREEARDATPTSLISRPPVSSPPSTAIRQKDKQPERTENPVNSTTTPNPGSTLAYPTAQGALQPGTGTTTAPTNGTNNQLNILPASNTTNQGKFP